MFLTSSRTNHIRIIMATNTRLDLSDWIVHFVHDRKETDDMYVMAGVARVETGVRQGLISYFDEQGNPVDLSDEYLEKEYPIEDNEPAFGVLQKIIHDGYIRSGWSFRNFNPTIYGPYSATCFTEMPLHALIKYARDRGSWSGYVGNYGIAFRRSELYQAGARPVIYGLSSQHKTADDPSDKNYGRGLRCLSDTCGLGLDEQYRYVYTNLGAAKSTDWMHEREWRWALRDNSAGIDGMGFLLAESWGYQFNELVIIVSSNEEQNDVLEQLKIMYDAGGRACGIEYNRKLIAATKVLSLEALAAANIDINNVRLEDVPALQIPVNTVISVSEATRNKVIKAVAEAQNVYNNAIDKFLIDHPDYETPPLCWGSAMVHTYEVSEVTQAMLNEKLIDNYGDGRYSMHVGRRICDDMDLEEIGARAAAKYLTQVLGQAFYTHTIDD